jgi:hypothetical protein
VLTASIIIALMIEAVSTSETSVNFYQTTQRNIPEDGHFHTERRKNLTSHNVTNSRSISPCHSVTRLPCDTACLSNALVAQPHGAPSAGSLFLLKRLGHRRRYETRQCSRFAQRQAMAQSSRLYAKACWILFDWILELRVPFFTYNIKDYYEYLAHNPNRSMINDLGIWEWWIFPRLREDFPDCISVYVAAWLLEISITAF